MNVLLCLIAELSTIAAGFGLAVLLRPARPLDRIELAGLALLLGSATISLLLFVFSFLVQGAALVATASAVSVAFGIAGIRTVSRLNLAGLPGSAWFAGFLMLALFLVGWQAGNHPLTADGLFNFEIRAQLAARHGGIIPPAFFSDPSRIWMHQGYPLLLPLNQVWIYLWLGAPHQGLGQLLSLHFTAAAGCLLFSGLARLTGERWRGGVACGLLFLVPSAIFQPGGAASVWADFPLAILFLAALIYLVEFAVTGGALAYFSTFLALLPWAKREGIVLATVLAAAAMLVAWRRGQLPRALLALLPLAAVTLGWKVFLLSVHASADRDFIPVSLGAALEHADRLPFLLTALARELVSWERWNLLWLLAVPAFVTIFRDPALARWRILAPITAALLGIYVGVYVFSAWTSLPLHVITSLPRLLLPISLAVLLAVGAAVPPIRSGAANAAADLAVLDAPQLGITFPTVERSAVEDGYRCRSDGEGEG